MEHFLEIRSQQLLVVEMLHWKMQYSLSRMCKKVYLIHRRDEFRGAKILQDEVKKNDKIEILWNTIVTKIDGDEVVQSTTYYKM